MVSKTTQTDTIHVMRQWRDTVVMLAATALLSSCVSTGHFAPPAPPVTPSPAPAPPPASTPKPTAPAPTTPPRPAAASASPADALVLSAVSLIGTPYRYGGDSPGTGFDCSGFVVYLMAMEDIAMPRTVQEQFRVGAHVSRNRLRAGDLVFFTTTGPGATHVGIVIDAEHTQFVHAPTTGSNVRVDSLESDYWRQRWVGARRVL